MKFEWTNDLSVGYGPVDDDHKALFERLEQLHQSVDAGQDKATQAALLRDLISVTLDHFHREEAWMRERGWAGYETHKLAHDMLMREIRALEQRFAGDSLSLTSDVFAFLHGWLRNHICTYDRALATTGAH